MRYKVEFEEKIGSIRVGSINYKESTVWLNVNGELLDPIPDSMLNKRIRNQLMDSYWHLFRSCYLDGYRMIVRLSGLNFNSFEMQDFRRYRGEGVNIIVHYNDWEMGDYTDYNKYSIIECDINLFKKLYKRYWLNVFWEIQFEGYVIPPNKSRNILEWSQRKDSEEKDNELLAMSILKIDNMEHGFHYKITARENVFKKLRRTIENYEF